MAAATDSTHAPSRRSPPYRDARGRFAKRPEAVEVFVAAESMAPDTRTADELLNEIAIIIDSLARGAAASPVSPLLVCRGAPALAFAAGVVALPPWMPVVASSALAHLSRHGGSDAR